MGNQLIIAVILGTLLGFLGFLGVVHRRVTRIFFFSWCPWSKNKTPYEQKGDDINIVSPRPPGQTSSSISLPSLLALQQVQGPEPSACKIMKGMDISRLSPLPPIATPASTPL